MGFRRFLAGIPLGPCMWVAAGWQVGVWCQRFAAAWQDEKDRNR